MDKIKRNRHLKTIKAHCREVRKWCFKMGIPLRGLLHDRSKFSKEEMAIADWYTGTSSPHDACRKEKGYSISWIYHYHRNDHHWEYWLDFNTGYYNEYDEFIIKPTAMKMPYDAVIEMVCDFIAAGKVYSGADWTPSMPYEYYWKFKNNKLYHKDTEDLFVTLLKLLKEWGEDKFIKMYKSMRKDLKKEYEAI